MPTPHKIEVHLYGMLRAAAGCQDKSKDCMTVVGVPEDATIAGVLAELGIPLEHTSNIFLNGQLSLPKREVSDGDRLGVFPSDMALLYKWYFAKNG